MNSRERKLAWLRGNCFKTKGVNTMKKKLICLILSIMLVLTMLPLSVSAHVNWYRLDTQYNPNNIIIVNNNDSYVSLSDQQGIAHYDDTGHEQAGFGSAFQGKTVTAMCFASNGDVLTGDIGGETGLVKIDPESGNIIKSLIPNISVYGVGTDSGGSIYVNTGKKLLKYDSSGQKLWGDGRDAIIPALNNDNYEVGITLLSDGSIITTCPNAGSIQKYKPDGTPDTSFGTNGSLKIANIVRNATYSDAIYVACSDSLSSETGTIKKVSIDGKDITTVYSGPTPATCVVAEGCYYCIPLCNEPCVKKFDILGCDDYSCTISQRQLIGNSKQQVSLTLSAKWDDCQVTAKLVNRATGEIPNVQCTTATLNNGKATLMLTPPETGWPQGQYYIDYCLTGSSADYPNGTNLNTIRASETISVGDIMITAQPQSAKIADNQDAALIVEARSVTGANHFQYQWFKDGSPISGATSSNYVIKHAQRLDSGKYSVSISNGLNEVQSDEAVIEVVNANQIVSVISGISAGDVIRADITPAVINGLGTGNVGVNLGNVSITLPTSVLTGLFKFGGYCTVRLSQQSTSLSTDQLSKLPAGDTPISYDEFNLDGSFTDGSSAPIHQLGGNVQVALHLTPTQAAQIQNSSDDIVVLYYNPETGSFTDMGAAFDFRTQIVTFSTNHFSKFVICKRSSGSLSPVSTSSGSSFSASANPKTGSNDSPFIPAILVMCSAGTLVAIKKKFRVKSLRK